GNCGAKLRRSTPRPGAGTRDATSPEIREFQPVPRDCASSACRALRRASSEPPPDPGAWGQCGPAGPMLLFATRFCRIRSSSYLAVTGVATGYVLDAADAILLFQRVAQLHLIREGNFFAFMSLPAVELDGYGVKRAWRPVANVENLPAAVEQVKLGLLALHRRLVNILLGLLALLPLFFHLLCVS